MSYDFLLFKAKKTIQNASELNESTTVTLGTANELRAFIDEHIASIQWQVAFGILENETGWYEFLVGKDNEIMDALTIRTSFRQNRAETEKQIQDFCNKLGLIAFDGNNEKLILPTSA